MWVGNVKRTRLSGGYAQLAPRARVSTLKDEEQQWLVGEGRREREREEKKEKKLVMFIMLSDKKDMKMKKKW